jgi:crotonobetainyl-CoA:carnitine CoA-transferase CaiB-like acyl-CoA transferase
VPFAPIGRVVARGLIAEFDQPTIGRVRQPKPAARFRRSEAVIGGPAPRVGEHSRDVLRDFG